MGCTTKIVFIDLFSNGLPGWGKGPRAKLLVLHISLSSLSLTQISMKQTSIDPSTSSKALCFLNNSTMLDPLGCLEAYQGHTFYAFYDWKLWEQWFVLSWLLASLIHCLYGVVRCPWCLCSFAIRTCIQDSHYLHSRHSCPMVWNIFSFLKLGSSTSRPWCFWDPQQNFMRNIQLKNYLNFCTLIFKDGNW